MTRYIFLSRQQIRQQWESLRQDPDNPRQDIATAEDFIRLIEAEGLVVGGAVVVLQDNLPLIKGT